MISRHENDKWPVVVQEPHRLTWSAEPDRLDPDAEHHGVAERGAFEIPPRLALHEIENPAAEVLGSAGHDQDRSLAVQRHGDRAASRRHVADAMDDATKRNAAPCPRSAEPAAACPSG